MIVFPNCKINLGLRVTAKRPDGYHDLETIFVPLPVKDILEILPATNVNGVQFTFSGLSIPGDTKNNLCVKAYELLKNDFSSIPGIRMHLHKQIPMGAGLGGGSADGAFTLLALNQMFDLALDEASLLSYASMLGSDCAFFIINKHSYGIGRGEVLEHISLHLNMKVVIVHPGIHINTAQAFSKITPAQSNVSLKNIVAEPVEVWKNALINDFEAGAFEAYPELSDLKQFLYRQGALYAAMTGTGSSIFGLFPVDSSPELSSIKHPMNIVNV